MVCEGKQSNCFGSKRKSPHLSLLQRHALCNLWTSPQVLSPKSPQHTHWGDQAFSTGLLRTILHQAIASWQLQLLYKRSKSPPVFFIHFLICEFWGFVCHLCCCGCQPAPTSESVPSSCTPSSSGRNFQSLAFWPFLWCSLINYTLVLSCIHITVFVRVIVLSLTVSSLHWFGILRFSLILLRSWKCIPLILKNIISSDISGSLALSFPFILHTTMNQSPSPHAS